MNRPSEIGDRTGGLPCRMAGWAWLAAVCSVLLGPGAASGDETLAERRRLVENMSPAEREDLLRRQQRFAVLDSAEQERLRRLHDEIEGDPQAAHLHEVMSRYHKWLMALPPYRRGEILELEPEQRIKRIQALLQEQVEKEAEKLNPEDIEGLRRWLQQYAAQQEAVFLDRVPEERRQRLKQLPPAGRNNMVLGSMSWRWHLSGPGKSPPLSEEELAKLRDSLSKATRQRLESKPVAEQWRILASGIRQVTRQQAAAASSKMASLDEEIARFFEHDLTDQQRNRLLSLPPEEMQRELRRMYLTEPSDHRPEHSIRGKRNALPEWDGLPPQKLKKGPRAEPSSPPPAVPRRSEDDQKRPPPPL